MSPRPLPEAAGRPRPLGVPPGHGANPEAHPGAAPLRGVPPSDHAPQEEAPELWLAVYRRDLSGPSSPASPASPEWEALAVRAQRFTSRVSLAPPHSLLLEIKGSLHLFGGLEPLLQAVTQELTRELGQKPRELLQGEGAAAATVAVAPVPRAALVAAAAGKPLIVTSPALLVGQLAPLPLAALGWPLELLERLASMGVRRIGQALRLPRAGFARRFGTQALADLEQLTGREPDLRQRHEAQADFRRRRELLHEIEHHGQLMGQLAPLFAELGAFLTTHQLAVHELTCLLWHRQGPPSRSTLRLAAPEGDPGRLASLLEERLRQQQLTQPVRACELEADELVPCSARSGSLWQPGEHGGGGAADRCGIELIERLRTRLGAPAVYGLALEASHRPESAWRATVPAAAASRPAARKRAAANSVPGPESEGRFAARRPVWLLRMPQRLPEREGRPWRPGQSGPLRLLAPEPERIETGWWDGAEVRRDYYLAEDTQGVRLWIFREHAAPRSWYLHGVFA